MEGAKYGKVRSYTLGNLFGYGFTLVDVGILYLYWIEVKYAYVGIWCEEVEIEDVDLSKSITNPFDPLLIVRDPYNSRNIKELYYIAIENPFVGVYVSSVVISPQH